MKATLDAQTLHADTLYWPYAKTKEWIERPFVEEENFPFISSDYDQKVGV